MDNPIIQPYLDKWQEEHNRVYKDCLQTFGPDPSLGLRAVSPTVSPAPSMSVVTSAPTCLISSIDSMTPNTESVERNNGLMFDVHSVVPSTIAIQEMDINIWNTDTQSISIYAMSGSWQTADAVTNQDVWTLVGLFQVIGNGKNNPTRVTLDSPILISPQGTAGVYIIQTTNDDLYSTLKTAADLGSVSQSDGKIQLLVGQQVGGEIPFQADEVTPGFSFNGVLYYTACGAEGRLLRRSTETRRLDHDYINEWYVKEPKPPIDFSTKQWWDPFRLWTSPVSVALSIASHTTPFSTSLAVLIYNSGMSVTEGL